MIADEPVLPYNRPMLTKNLFGRHGGNPNIKDEQWYSENKINLMIGKSASEIHPDSKSVKLSDGSTLSYDKLILATGANAFIPPIPGHEQSGVFAIRKLSDTDKIRDLIDSVDSVVVIGGGVLGLEAAWEFNLKGKNVTVLELGPALMARQLEPETSEALRKAVEAKGVKCFTGIEIDKITGDGTATGVLLKDGTNIPAELVIMSTGVRANVALAQAAGINAERNIFINEKAETNLPDIFACGDCAEFNGINFAIIPQAEGQGATAGANAVGDNVIYEQANPAVYFEGFGINLEPGSEKGKTILK